MKNLLLLSLLLPALISCTIYTREFTRTAETVEHFTPSFLEPTQFEASFRLQLMVYTHHYGGILALRKQAQGQYRLVLLHETGGRLLDTRLVDGRMEVLYGIEPLQRKTLLRNLEKIFALALQEKAVVTGQFVRDDTIMYRAKSTQGILYYHLPTAAKTLPTKSVIVSCNREKIRCVYHYTDKGYPDMELSRPGMKLEIKLQLLDYKLVEE